MSPLGNFLRGATPRPNAAPALCITLARRLVETPGAPFVPTGEVFTDAASVLDELGLLPASQGPTIVRVRVEGGTASEQEALEGDWLVDPDAGDFARRLPGPRWVYDDEAKTWSRERPWLEAWETCPNAAWMLLAAGKERVSGPLLALAACACARTALRFVPSGEARPLAAIEAAERWARGEANVREVRVAVTSLWGAYDLADDIVSAASARGTARSATRVAAAAIVAAVDAASIANPANASEAATRAAGAASRAAEAASRAAEATTLAAPDANAARAMSLVLCADLVRGMIPTLTVLRAVAARV